jgi:rare lipoprotein A
MASYYGNELAGSLTASGDVFNPGGYTAAHKTLPFGTKVQFCYQGCVVATINDRGPFVDGREYDLSKATADTIGLTHAGTGDVSATVL